MRLIFALLLSLIYSSAFAQNTTCATRPVSDNSNACASTAWVALQNFLTGNQTITLSGDCTGTGSTSIVSTCTKTNGVAFGTLATLNAAPAGTLTGTTLNATVLNSSLTSVGAVATGRWNDTSEVIGSGAAKWNPLFFTNPGTGVVHRFNRILCGEATASSSDIGPVTTKDWLETLVPNTTAASEFVCVDTTGQLGAVAASRTGDFRTFNGSASQGSQGVTGFGYNNDTGAGNPIAVGGNLVGIAASGVTGITGGNQMDMNNASTTVDVTPFGGVVASTTFAGLFTSGAIAGLSSTNTSAAWIIGQGRTGGPKHRKGGICLDGALDATVGGGGDGECIEAARNQTVTWRNSGGTIDGEITANASGIQFTTDQAWTAFTATPTCGTATITTNSARRKTLGKTTFVEVSFTITAIGTCTTNFTFTLPNAPQSAAYLSGSEEVNSHLAATCSVSSTTSNCLKSGAAAFSVNDRIVVSGVYENQ